MFVQNLQGVNNLKFTYDHDHDVLYLYFGEPKTSYEDEAAPGIFLRISDDDDEILTGLIIFDYKKKLPSQFKKYIPVNVDFSKINQLIQ